MSVTITKGGSAPSEQTINVTVQKEEAHQHSSLPETANLVLIASVSAVVAWGITQAIKSGVRGYARSKGKRKDPWWLTMALRLTSCGVGATAGYALFHPLDIAGASAWGAAVGAGGGALATVIVAALKARIRGAGNAQES